MEGSSLSAIKIRSPPLLPLLAFQKEEEALFSFRTARGKRRRRPNPSSFLFLLRPYISAGSPLPLFLFPGDAGFIVAPPFKGGVGGVSSHSLPIPHSPPPLLRRAVHHTLRLLLSPTPEETAFPITKVGGGGGGSTGGGGIGGTTSIPPGGSL